MNTDFVKKEFQKLYPGKRIIENTSSGGTVKKLICEVEPTLEHEDYSVAICVCDEIISHYHFKTEEEYEILRGQLELKVGGETYFLQAGDKVSIPKNTVHSGKGNQTWIKCISKPGWKIEDHLILP